MPRLIDANKLMEVICKNAYSLKSKNNSEDYGMFLNGIRQAVEEQPTYDGWVSAKDPPKENGEYLVVADDREDQTPWMIWNNRVVVPAEYYNGTWTWSSESDFCDISDMVTHWMPPPELPEE